jgi:hypothetical protein
MLVKFVTRGRLGNAIFRYMASAIICIHFNAEYYINDIPYYTIDMTDQKFLNLVDGILNNKKIEFQQSDNIIMNYYYQHDLIYKKYKNEIINFITKNKLHYILTDGILAGDCHCQQFYMYDIINTALNFNKKYNNVLHLRLEDFVTHNLYIDKKRIVHLLNKNIITNFLCIVCKKPNTEFEYEYIKYITDFLNSINIKYILEHNDVLTDYYIMKEAEIFICSKSTLSWCAAFFSDKIKKCYLPDYDITPNSTCKFPIDNTELY